MAERPMSDEALGRALSRLEPAYPPTPSLVPGVVVRLEADRAARARPPFPRIAIWGRRRLLALAAIGVLALVALAFGARFVIGSAEVRVQPGASPSGPPFGSDALGPSVPLEEVAAATGFPLALPPGPAPDAAYVVSTIGGDAALLTWDPSDRYPAVPGTPWGLALLELPEGRELAVKDVNAFEDLHPARVSGRRAFWIDAPHGLILQTEAGTQPFSVEGNVLIWALGDVTLRLETSLGLDEAIALAERIG